MEHTGFTLFGRPVTWKDIVVVLMVSGAGLTFFAAVGRTQGESSLRSTLLYQPSAGADTTVTNTKPKPSIGEISPLLVTV
eukprot:6354082-Pyramimonas_sp.AAC.1